MFRSLALASLVYAGLAQNVNPNNYTIINGQIFTPGLAIVDAPQPNTPLGGDFLQVALDVSYDGAIGLPPYKNTTAAQIHNITIFLYSYDTGKNFTITNGTASRNNASLGDVMLQEPSSTVKHVNWIWPDCLVGNGESDGNSSSGQIGNRTNLTNARGIYNISMHQSFELNGTNYYTIFDLPIDAKNSIQANNSRPSCDSLNNRLLPANQTNATGVPVVLPGSVPKNGGNGSSGSGEQIGGKGAAASLLPQLSTAMFAFVFGSVVVLGFD